MKTDLRKKHAKQIARVLFRRKAFRWFLRRMVSDPAVPRAALRSVQSLDEQLGRRVEGLVWTYFWISELQAGRELPKL